MTESEGRMMSEGTSVRNWRGVMIQRNKAEVITIGREELNIV